MSGSHQKYYRSIHQQVRSGELGEARRAVIAALRAKRIPRDARLELAYLARRVSMLKAALQLMHRYVRGDNADRARPEEIAEYGIALAELGESVEAIELLSKVDSRTLPRVFLGGVLAYFRIGEWKKALP